MAERLTECTPTHRYLKTIKLNDVKVPWETKDMSYLMKVRRSAARRRGAFQGLGKVVTQVALVAGCRIHTTPSLTESWERPR